MTSSHKVVAIIAIVFLALVLFVGGLWFKGSAPYMISDSQDQTLGDADAQNRSPEKETLPLRGSSAFEAAEKLRLEGEKAAARSAYQSLLNTTNDRGEHGVLMLGIAMATDNVEEQIRLLKVIGADERYENRERARAIEYLGILYETFLEPEATTYIFTEKPYNNFYREGDADLAYVRLFGYAGNLYPTLLAEAYKGVFYAEEAGRIKAEERPAPDGDIEGTVASYMALIDVQLEAINAGVLALGTHDPDGHAALAKALQGRIEAAVERAGESSRGDYKVSYDIALEKSTGAPKHIEAVVRYFYATDVLLSGESRAVSEVRSILAPVVTDIDNFPLMKEFFRGERQDVFGEKGTLIGIANVYPAFKTLLTTLGWASGNI